MNSSAVEKAVKLLKSLGITRWKVENVAPTEFSNRSSVNILTSECPFAKYKHSNGIDSNPSFKVSLTKDGNLVYHCFGCEVSGRLYDLPAKLAQISGRYDYCAQDIAMDIFSDEAENSDSADEASAKQKKLIIPIAKKIDNVCAVKYRALSEVSTPVPNFVLERFPELLMIDSAESRKALSWLVEDRKISKGVITKYRLRLYSNDSGVGVIFPIIGFDSRVYDLWVRLVDEKRFFRITPEMVNSNVNFGTKTLMFGCHLITPTQSAIIVEGALDALRLATLGVKAVPIATLGSPSELKMLSLPVATVFLGFDADKAGKQFTRKAISYLRGNVKRIFLLDWGVVGKKDAGELESVDELQKVKDKISLLFSAKGFEKVEFAKQLV